MKKERIEFIDALKGFTILMVLWGHSLQYLKKGYDFFHNPMFEFIYSFHMPLFFMLSGFFFRSTMKLDLKDFLVKKSKQLILPCAVWSVIFFLMWFSINIIKGYSHYLNDWLEIPKRILSGIFDIWFLIELFISCFIVFVSMKVLKKEWLACVLSISFVLIFPFWCEVQRVFLPIFWIGLFIKYYDNFFLKYVKQISIISGVIFAICLLFWDGDYTMYVANFPSLIRFKELGFNFTNIDISIFRFCIGLCGSIFFFTLFGIVYSDNKFFSWLSKIGVNTLAIYLLQRLILEDLTKRIIDFSNMNTSVYSLLITPFVALLILIICLAIIKGVQKINYAELFLFGK